jgi:hypothetical protein
LTQFIFESDYRKATFSERFGQIFSLKIVSLLIFCPENQSGQLRFRAGRMQKKRPALKGSSANQIASFWLIKNKGIY